MKAPQEILDLVARFDQNFEAYQSGKYNETQIRREFIDPFFKALGWDVENISGYAEAYKDVIHEDAIKIGSANKAPDYSFRTGGTRKFFVEAKKPSVNIAADIGPAYQLRRYAWSAKLPLSILTDFEEFAVYDCRVKPDKGDKATTARIMYLNYKDYSTRWKEIADVFSKEAVMKGSFDKYAESAKVKKGTAGVDAAFLSEIDSWRQALAQNIALRNSKLSQRELNYSVGKTIDRIIFLRICEDRGIEPYGQLLALQNGVNIYQRLIEIYYSADDKYNSGLFHFKQEKERSAPPDDLTLTLFVDDKIFKDIFKSLYYPESPYEFSVLPADILGQVYEQFLGKVIHLTPGHRAKVEEKPEVRKAGGVYYTPTYIVDYIVKNTVGKLLEGKTPKTAEKLRILDPACGSGSFLIGAYQYLLDWHRDKYVDDDPEKYAKGKNPALYQKIRNEWRLTTAERKRILLNNIYGVDIDPQAVEVTKLSLLLKVLEGESDQTIKSSFKLFQERALPDLGNNIKCGNSLIGPDYYEGKQTSFLDTEEMQRVNPFDWDKEFSEIFKAGGFDAVIGNPPYIRSVNLKEYNHDSWEYYSKSYNSASSREWDTYLIFVEKGLSLLNQSGKVGYILPNKFLNSKVGENLRHILAKGKYLEKLLHFGAYQVFYGVTTYTCLLFLNKNGSQESEIMRYKGTVNEAYKPCTMPEENIEKWDVFHVSNVTLTASTWDFSSSASLLEKLRKWPPLGSIAIIYQGTGTRADKVFLMEKRRSIEGKLLCLYSFEKNKEYLLEKIYIKPVLRGRSINRYALSETNQLLIVPYEIVDDKYTLVPKEKLAHEAPKTLSYFNECRNRLNERENGRFIGEDYYCFGRPQNMTRFEVPEKIVLPDVANRGTCFLDREQNWLLDTCYGVIMLSNTRIRYHYLLGIMNSQLLTYFLKQTGTALRGDYFRMKTAYLSPFPIRTIDFNKPAEKKMHDNMVQLVDQMLELNKQLPKSKTDHEKTLIQRQIDTTDKQIDKLVYELYDLTEEEIKIAEGR